MCQPHVSLNKCSLSLIQWKREDDSNARSWLHKGYQHHCLFFIVPSCKPGMHWLLNICWIPDSWMDENDKSQAALWGCLSRSDNIASKRTFSFLVREWEDQARSLGATLRMQQRDKEEVLMLGAPLHTKLRSQYVRMASQQQEANAWTPALSWSTNKRRGQDDLEANNSIVGEMSNHCDYWLSFSSDTTSLLASSTSLLPLSLLMWHGEK